VPSGLLTGWWRVPLVVGRLAAHTGFMFARVRNWFDGAGWFVGLAVALFVFALLAVFSGCSHRTGSFGPVSRLPVLNSEGSSTTGGKVSHIRSMPRVTGLRKP
jgi:hypothetical protein